MSKLCERPGCSDPGAAAYGMIPEDLIFWIAPLRDAPDRDANVLCRRHADAMVVPRGWTLDDRREPFPRLFLPKAPTRSVPAAEAASPRRRRPRPTDASEQLQIDGTGELDRPLPAAEEPTKLDPSGVPESELGARGDEPHRPWQPEFDTDDDLDGLLEVRSPLLARAFRGTDRRRG